MSVVLVCAIGSSGLAPGAIAGIVLGTILGTALLVLLLVWICCCDVKLIGEKPAKGGPTAIPIAAVTPTTGKI